jgi:hypothetical protein
LVVIRRRNFRPSAQTVRERAARQRASADRVAVKAVRAVLLEAKKRLAAIGPKVEAALKVAVGRELAREAIGPAVETAAALARQSKSHGGCKSPTLDLSKRQFFNCARRYQRCGKS